jgi:hypothetical protein
MKRKMPRGALLDLGWILFVTAASSLLAYSGWREQSPLDSPDILSNQEAAIEFVTNGVIPFRGQGLSYSGYGPPGTSFLLVPGVLLMADPRLAEVPGAVLLHFGTLLFIYLIVRGWIGRGAAWAAVALAGFLPFTGPTLWPNGHPFFVAGMLYCLLRWVRDRSAHWFSAALLLAGLGMYVYFTIAPALIAMAVIALVFRRPISIRSLAGVLLILFAVWLPYLHFETGRNFTDISSMILRRDLESGSGTASAPVYCYASLPGESDFQGVTYMPWTGLSNQARVIFPRTGRLAGLELTLCTLFNKLDRNFDSGFFLSSEPVWPTAVLFGMYLTGWMVLFFRSVGTWRRPMEWLARLRAVPAWKFLIGCGIGILAICLLIQPVVFGTLLVGDPDWDLPARLLLTQVRMYGAVFWISLVIGAGLASRWDMTARDAGVLAIMIAVCGFLLVGLSEIERSWRFWWFWALQSIAVAAALEGWIRAWKWPRWMAAGWVVLAMAVFFPFRSAASSAEAIIRDGYGGRESGQIQAMEWLAGKAGEDTEKIFSIGVMRYHGESDPTLAWGWLEFGFKYMFPTPNARAADPLPDNDFRVVEFLGSDRGHHPVECPWDGFQPVWIGWRYTICQRLP